MVKSATLGMPRIGSKCEVSNAVHNFIQKQINQNELQAIGKKVREDNLKIQKDLDIDIIPSNDFTFFDHVLDTTVLLGNIPRKYYWEGGAVSLDIYFTMITGQQREKFDVTPMNIARWFNTNYLYVVPEFSDPEFSSPEFSDPEFSHPEFSDPEFSYPKSSVPEFSLCRHCLLQRSWAHGRQTSAVLCSLRKLFQ